MARRRAIRAVLQGFLAAYVRQYSEPQAYWLFGILDSDLGDESVDLLREPPSRGLPPTVLDLTLRQARKVFREQLSKGGLHMLSLRSASLRMRRMPMPKQVQVNGKWVTGYEIKLGITAVSEFGKTFFDSASIVGAPRDPCSDLRSWRIRRSGLGERPEGKEGREGSGFAHPQI